MRASIIFISFPFSPLCTIRSICICANFKMPLGSFNQKKHFSLTEVPWKPCFLWNIDHSSSLFQFCLKILFISKNISGFGNFSHYISRTASACRTPLCVQASQFMHAKNFLHAKIRPGYFSGRIQKSYYLLSSVFPGFRCDRRKINP